MKFFKKTARSVAFALIILSVMIPRFAFSESGSEIVDIDLNANKAIENRLKRGAVEGFKSDEKGEALQGAVFGLFREEETDFKKENAIVTDISDENGVFGFSDLPFGRYKIYEISPPPGYQADGKIYDAVIDDDSEVVNISACNHPVVIAKTGDKALLGLWSATGIYALLTGILIYTRHYRKKQGGTDR